MKKILVFIVAYSLIGNAHLKAQATAALPKGSLFIIGGGDRPPSIMRSLVATAGFGAKDYVVVLPMSSQLPDTGYYYFKQDLSPFFNGTIANLNFTRDKINDRLWLDSLVHAKMIFITGGDQGLFMKVVMNTPVYDAIHAAYQQGATIAGTSAGAAVMSKYMITGKELTDTTYRATFRKVRAKNLETTEGLGLLTDAIIDQHFIVRSRYNRLLSALAGFPSLACIGIDEATAIIVKGNKVTVAGESQVVVFKNPDGLKVTASGLVKLKDIQFSMYTEGDEFLLK